MQEAISDMFTTCLAAGATDIVLPAKAISYTELIRQLKDKGLIKPPTPPGPAPPPPPPPPALPGPEQPAVGAHQAPPPVEQQEGLDLRESHAAKVENIRSEKHF